MLQFLTNSTSHPASPALAPNSRLPRLPCLWPGFLVGQVEKPVRVLIVDDDAHMSRVIANELLADLRIDLLGQGASLREGRRLIRQYPFDVLLVDLNLRDGTGFSLIEEMKALRPAAEAIVISTLEDEQHALHAFELGATGYLVKNSWFGNFAQAVLQVVNGGASITPNLARRLLGKFESVAHPGRLQQSKGREPLSPREKDVLKLVASGNTSNAIGARLTISAQTVNTHIKNIYRKLDVRSRAQAVSCAASQGFL